jgi:hypothetical protein
MSTPSGHDRITELLARPRRRGRAGSPAVAGFVGTMADAAAITEQMALISAGCSTRFKLPTRDNAGTPLGADVRRVGHIASKSLTHGQWNDRTSRVAGSKQCAISTDWRPRLASVAR